MEIQNIKIQNVTCKGFIKTLSTMLIKIEGVDGVEIDHQDSMVDFKIKSAIPKEVLMKQLITEGIDSRGQIKSCKKCVLEKLEAM